MGIAFGQEHGGAKKAGLPYIKLEFGENKFRMVGNILPRYCYWNKLKDMEVPVECLSFDRELERFTNIETDWFQHYFPDKKCAWSYVIQVIDPKDGELKLLGLKKKLYEQIRDLMKDLGDPTDPKTGWDIVVEKKKTGPNPFNVEYKLKERVIQPRALTEEELEVYNSIKDIDELIPRPTAEQQKEFIEKAWINVKAEEENTDTDATDSFDDDDVAF